MCNHCYHTHGRKSYATACKHNDKMSYAKNLCKNCYLNSYNKTKRNQNNQKSILNYQMSNSSIEKKYW